MPIVSTAEVKEWSNKIDYCVVGGGTAGLALAARLSEDPNVVVLVVEAGSRHVFDPLVNVPGYRGRVLTNPKYDWTFMSVPQSRANNRRLYSPRGKGLGGSSMLNFFGMFRPSKGDIEALEKLGNEGWNWDSFLHYMKKSETLVDVPISEADAVTYAAKIQREFHGSDGPIKKCYPSDWISMQKVFFDSAEALGIPRNLDANGGLNVGAMSSLLSIDPTTATRSFSSSAYLEPNLDRKNLLVLLGAQVTKVILQKEGVLQKAVGVEFVKDGVSDRVEGFKKDVIISAGAFQTPQILELSGIGSQAILSKFGIQTLVELPGVGENLQDHLTVSTISEVETTDKTPDDLLIPEFMQAQEELYKKKGEGMFASGPPTAFIFVSAEQLGKNGDPKSLQDQVHSGYTEALAKADPSLKSGLEKQYAILREFFANKNQALVEVLNFVGHRPDPNSKPVPGKHYTSIGVALMHPLSRGSVHIASADPLAPPAIDLNFFANETDLDLIVDSVEFALTLTKTAPLGEHVTQVLVPPKEAVAKGREGLKEFVRATCGASFHPVGTAAMLPRQDGGVVDSKLKVHGTSNLRVVDLSILPLELSCHLQTVAYGIAEKAADILKQENQTL